MNKSLFVLFCLISSARLIAQDQHLVDSIIPLIKNDGSRGDMEIFFELGFQYIVTNHALSLEYLDKGLPIAYTLGDSLLIVKFNRMKGQVFLRDGQQEAALLICEKILPMARRLGFKREVGFILTTLGVTHSHMARFDRGLEYNFRSLESWRSEGDSVQIGQVLLNIGFVHYKVGNYDKAIDYFKKSLLMTEGKPGQLVTCLNYVNIGTAFVKKDNIPEARKWIRKGIASCGPNCSSQVLIPAEFGLAYSALYLDALDEAKVHFEHSYQLALQLEDHRFEAENLIYLAQIARKEKKYSNAEEYLKHSERISAASDFRNLLALAYYEFFELHRELKQTDKASVYLERHVSFRDSIHSFEVGNRISVMQIEFDEKEHGIEVAHKQELLAKQKTQTLLIAIVCILSVFIAIGLFLGLRSKQRANKKLDQRVLDRTKELELHKDALERAYHEQSKLIARTSQSIKSALATQRGLNARTNGVEAVDERELLIGKSIENELNNLAAEIAKGDRFADPSRQYYVGRGH